MLLRISDGILYCVKDCVSFVFSLQNNCTLSSIFIKQEHKFTLIFSLCANCGTSEQSNAAGKHTAYERTSCSASATPF